MKKTIKVLTAMCLLLPMLNCNLSPEVDMEEITPKKKNFENFEEQNPQLGDFEFWKEFKDPNLARFVEKVKENSLDWKNAELTIEKFQYLYKVSKSPLWPSISLNTGATRNKTNLGTFLPQGGSFKKTTYTANLSLSYEIDIFGKVRNQSAQSLYQFLQAKETQNGIKLSVIANSISLYLNYSELKKEASISEEIVKTNKMLLKTAKNQYLRGLISSNDFLAISNTLKQAEISKQTVLQTKFQTEQAIKNLLQLTDIKNLTFSDFEKIEIPLKTVKPGLPSELLKRRPDIKSSYADIKAKIAAYGTTKAKLFPSITLTASDGYSSTQLSNLLKGESNVWSFGFNLVQPIFNRGALKNQVKISEKELEIAINNYKKTVINAFGEVDYLLEKYNSLRKQIEIQKEIVKNNETILKRKKSEYAEGTGNYSDYLRQRITFLNQKNLLNKMYLNLALTKVNLYKALGGGIEKIKYSEVIK